MIPIASDHSDILGRMRPFRVFVGSTYQDLQSHRTAVLEALHKLEVAVTGMEYFGSQPGSPIDVCMSAVRRCTTYIGIFAMRYGSMDAETGKSITELEYEEAQRSRLPSLIYLIDEERQPVLPKYVDTGREADQLRELKKKLKASHTITFFTSPDDLAKRVLLDLSFLARDSGAEVNQSVLAKLIADIPRIDWMTDDRLDFLLGQLGPLSEQIQDREVAREVLEYLLSGDRQAAVFLLCRTTHRDIRLAIDFAVDVESILRQIIERGRGTLDAKTAAHRDPAS